MGKITDFLLNLQNPLNTHWMMIAIRLCVCVFACVFLTEIIIPSRFQSAIILSFMLLSLSVKSNTSCTDISYFSNSMLPGVLLMCYARFRLHNVSPIIAWCCRCKASGREGQSASGATVDCFIPFSASWWTTTHARSGTPHDGLTKRQD